MYSKIWIIALFSILNVWTLDISLKEFPNWISANSSFNSFIIPANELESTISKNSSSSGCVHLYPNKTKTDEQVLSAMCYKNDPKCAVPPSPLNLLRAFAPLNICKLKGNLTNVTIILEQDFIYVLVKGCYNIRKNKRTDYIWSFTNNTYLKYFIADVINNKSENISVKFINEIQFSVDGSSCENLCNAIFCMDSQKIIFETISNGPPSNGLDDVKTAKGFLHSLYIFGILAAVIVSVGCFIYVFHKLYNKV